jgi:hypothetical protein
MNQQIYADHEPAIKKQRVAHERDSGKALPDEKSAERYGMRCESGEQKRGWQATRHVAAKQIKKQAARRDQIRHSGQFDKKRVHRQGHYKLTLPAFKSEEVTRSSEKYPSSGDVCAMDGMELLRS